ncbi:MAG: rRNA maturation RNase YbeY [Lentisphaerae bacterium GWF2_57_35]|nr:MAG: rRNA maturation RNase YbeY [Lentisphaerae bacterium GWF2_57_35]
MVLTDNEGIRAYNLACFGKDRPTDVITQAYAAVPGGNDFHGELIVNAERALEEGLQRQSIDQELALYIAHGCDHLDGASDHTPPLRSQMRRREMAWLRQARQEGLLEDGLLAEKAASSPREKR